MSEDSSVLGSNIDIGEALDKLRELEIGDGGISEDESEPIELEIGNEPSPDEEPSIRLKNGIDRRDLMNVDRDGVDFEVIPEGISKEPETSMGKEYFDSEDYRFGRNIAFGEEEEGIIEEEYEGLSPFVKHIKKCNLEDITPEKDGKVWKRVTRKGTGSVVSDSALVRVNYSAWCEHADEPFDCTRMQERPRSLKLGSGECILGLDIGIQTMQLHETAELIIYPELAFGELGCPPRVPPNAIILFHVTLEQSIDHAGVDEYFKMGVKYRQDVPFDQMMRIMRAEREVGNDMFRRKHTAGALRRYRRASKALEDRRLADEKEETILQKALVKFYLNIAQCYIVQSKWPKVITYSSLALRIDGKHAKGLYKMGKALRKLSEYNRSRYFLRKGLQFSPNNSDLAKELKELDKDIKVYAASNKEICQRMFSSTAVIQDKKEEDSETIPPKEDSEKEEDDPLLSCSPDFKDSINRYLAEFIADNELQEMPFPASRFNKNELAYIGTIAKNMNLIVVYRGEGAKLQIRIRKK